MNHKHNKLDYRITGAASGESIDRAWQNCVAAGQPRPGVQPPTRCQLVDPPGPEDSGGSWSRKWTAKLDFGEAVGWPTRLDGDRQWYQFIGICSPVD